MLFLQAAGSDFDAAHDLVAAIAEVIRVPDDDRASRDAPNHGRATRRPVLDPERIAARFESTGYDRPERSHMALAVLATTASPLRDADVDWIASTAGNHRGMDLLLETAGVVFAFNTINRIADARRVRLEYGFLRQFKPIQGWVERRMVSLTAMAYDLSVKHHARYSQAALLDRSRAVFARLGVPNVPSVIHWLSRSPVVLEGVLEMIESNVTHARVHSDLLRAAIAIGVASRAMPGSDLTAAVDPWLPRDASCDAQSLRAWAAPHGASTDLSLVTACRRYAWQVANAAYTITDEQICELTALGLSDAELLDLTLATAVFSALAIIEPIGMAAAISAEQD